MRAALNLPLCSRAMFAVLIAQFLSALADNAILIAAIAIVKQHGQENLIPILQESFVVPFILLAPFVGHVADRFPKGRVMLIGNLLKLAGAVGMTLGMNPFTAYGMIGVGAAMYSPAKYGILSQLFSADKLVRANGLMEGSTIVAILLGVLLGGWLADLSLQTAFYGVIAAYALAACANLLIPRVMPELQEQGFNVLALVKQFCKSLATMWRNPDARFSLIGTSVFWGSGSTLRLILFAWVPVALLINDNQTPANLMGGVSIGIVVGAALAGVFITLERVNYALIGGLLLGPAIAAMAYVQGLSLAYVCMIAIGVCGGMFVVPLNALLQKSGHDSIGAGNALAVQNFFENIAMLLLVGVYSLMKEHVSVLNTVLAFGLLMLLVMGMLAVDRFKRSAHRQN